MSFEFKFREPVADGIRRIARSELDAAIADLRGRRGVSREKAVHETRKRLKKIRALLRLVRDSIGGKVFSRESRALRDIGRAMSSSRDAAVLVEAFDQVLERLNGKTSVREHQPARAVLQSRRRASQRAHGGAATKDLLQTLRTVKSRLAKFSIAGKEFKVIRRGLRRSFRRGREAFEAAIFDRDVVTLHAWRKRVKDLLFHTALLQPMWPDLMQTLGEKIHALSDTLGEDHDLAMLRKTLSDESTDLATPEALDALLAVLDARRIELQQVAMHLGERIYAERPRNFIERMENYWNAWRSGQTVT